MPTDNQPVDETSEKSTEKPWWAEMMRELTMTGLATFFMTEDSIRNYLKEKKFPKELMSFFLDGVNRKKDDFYGLLAKEFGRVLGKMDLTQEMTNFLEKHEVKVDAKFSFTKKEKETV